MSTRDVHRLCDGATARWLSVITILTSLAACGPSRPGPVGVVVDGGVDAGFGSCAKVQCRANADCNDNIPCTVDSCTFPDGMEQVGYCRHVPGGTPCPSGQFCLVGVGCRVSRKCGSVADCADKDPCHALVACDGATATCSYQLLDKDGDGHAPTVCGGDDCDDTNPRRFKCHVELCDGSNNDCTSDAEANAVCPGGFRECRSGACSCLAARTCGANRCQDDDELNCGGCGISCPKGATCVTGRCRCPATGRVDDKGEPVLQKDCGGTCVDTDKDANNCGTCGTSCGPLGRCSGGTCSCPAPGVDCGAGMCVSTLTDAKNCGDCANECNPGHMCKSGVCDANCQGLISCANLCKDLTCVGDCKRKASVLAVQLWDSLDACLTNACPNFDQACWSAAQKPGGACRQELVNCQTDP